MSKCIELYITLKLRISSIRIWRPFGGFVMQGHIYSTVQIKRATRLSSAEVQHDF